MLDLGLSGMLTKMHVRSDTGTTGIGPSWGGPT